jgi:P-type Ca2+ transporter type 2B
MDPLKEGVAEAIKKVSRAGLSVIMVTGDNLDTAKAIARKAGIIQKDLCNPGDASESSVAEASEPDQTARLSLYGKQNYECMTGMQFRNEVGGFKTIGEGDEAIKVVADMEKFSEIVDHLKVLARSSPQDKLLLVTGLKQRKEVVAVTGDGTNDAPALRKADVGFAMFNSGTQIAHASSDIILLDDNFSSIVDALKFGRNVYDNVRKFIQFQVQVSAVAMGLVFIGSIVLKESPLNAVQMLWVNLIIDTFAALALATEPPTEKLLTKSKQEPRNAPIISASMYRNIIGHSVYQIAILIGLIFFASFDNLLIYDY